MNNETTINYKILVYIDRSTSDPLTTDDSSDVFFGVVWRKKTFSFYMSNIDQKSTISGIVHCIEFKGANVTHCAIFSDRQKTNVNKEHAELLEQLNFWPHNIRSRK